MREEEVLRGKAGREFKRLGALAAPKSLPVSGAISELQPGAASRDRKPP
jgi:hypothetical protein